MRWTELSRGIIYWGGMTDEAIIGLGGSIRHIIGSPDLMPESFREVGSFDDSILYALSQDSHIAEALNTEYYSGKTETLRSLYHKYRVYEPLPEMLIAEASMQLDQSDTGVKRPLEFLAKTLLRGQHESKAVLLATPIYVAMAE